MKWKEIYEFPDGDCAVCNGKELMLQQSPHLISVMPEEMVQEVFEHLRDKAYQHPRLAAILDRKTNQETLKYLLDKEYKMEVKIIS